MTQRRRAPRRRKKIRRRVFLAGLGGAMGNSREEIRDCADWVTGTNDSDGIADVLHRFVLTAA